MLESNTLHEGMIADVVGIRSLQMGVFGGIVVGLGVAALCNRFYKIRLPSVLSFFGGSRFIPIISTLVYIPVGLLLFFLWPYVQNGIYALGEAPDCPRKPAADMVYQGMKAIGADRCIYVGDSEVDVLTAANAGVPCASVLWGFRDREDLEKAGGRYYCADPGNLTEMIEEIINGK